MKQCVDPVLYPVADCLGMNLQDMGDRWRAFATRTINVGPWEFDADVSVVGDCQDMTSASFFVKIVGGLWLYIVSEYQKPLVIYAVDGGMLKLFVKDAAGYGGKSTSATLKKIRHAITAAYILEEPDGAWKDYGLDHLDADSKTQNSVRALISASTLPTA